MKAEDEQLQEPAKPIGEFILNRSDINGKPLSDGLYYHYSDVCTLLKEYARIQIEKDRERVKLNAKTKAISEYEVIVDLPSIDNTPINLD